MAKKHIANLITGLFRGRRDRRRERRVRLIEAARRPPVTPVEQVAVATLARHGAMPFDRLGEQVALDLYRDALSRGAGILDLGFFGQGLFIREALLELEAGDGTLWEIESQEDET
jgi:hypothetical protein